MKATSSSLEPDERRLSANTASDVHAPRTCLYMKSSRGNMKVAAARPEGRDLLIPLNGKTRRGLSEPGEAGFQLPPELFMYKELPIGHLAG